MTDITFENVKNAILTKGYTMDVKGLHIVGLRRGFDSTSNTKSCTNRFDDYICAIDNNTKTLYGPFKATTVPGRTYLVNPMNGKNTCYIMEGQYVDAFCKGNYYPHKGQPYPALRQHKALHYHLDSNRNDVFDADQDEWSMRNTHIHKAGKNSVQVDTWSAGCQVFATEADFLHFMEIVNKVGGNGNLFTYTLLAWD